MVQVEQFFYRLVHKFDRPILLNYPNVWALGLLPRLMLLFVLCLLMYILLPMSKFLHSNLTRDLFYIAMPSIFALFMTILFIQRASSMPFRLNSFNAHFFAIMAIVISNLILVLALYFMPLDFSKNALFELMVVVASFLVFLALINYLSHFLGWWAASATLIGLFVSILSLFAFTILGLTADSELILLCFFWTLLVCIVLLVNLKLKHKVTSIILSFAIAAMITPILFSIMVLPTYFNVFEEEYSNLIFTLFIFNIVVLILIVICGRWAQQANWEPKQVN